MHLTIPDLEPEIHFKTSRSGGKGGQHVNKVSTKVELNFCISESQLLTPEQKDLLLEKLSGRLTKDGMLQIVAQTERSQLGNKRIALQKLYTLLAEMLIVQKKRKPTKVPKSVKEKRLVTKKRQAEIKKQRRTNDYE